MKVLFAGTAFERLKGRGVLAAFTDHEVRITGEDGLREALPWAEVLVTGPREIGSGLLAEAKSLQLVQQWGTGVEGIDLDACRRYGIRVCNVPSRGTGNAESVAEMALLLMLLLARHYGRAQENLFIHRRVHAPQGVSLWKKAVCLVGLGNLGRCIAERLACLGMEVRGVNRTRRPEFASWGVGAFYPLEDLEKAVEGSRFLVLALPLNDRTRGIVSRPTLKALGPAGFLVNVARAGLVCRRDLEEALETGEIAGAGLDVFWEEPPDPRDPLLERPNVVAMPHVGGVTDAGLEGITRFIRDNLDRYARGEPLYSEVNARTGDIE